MTNNKQLSVYHEPVLLDESIKGLEVKPNGLYVDVTYGGGGHSKAILKMLKDGMLYAFDHDDDAEKNTIKDERFVFIYQNFKYLIKYLKLHKAIPVDGILADLGVSSHQIDTPQRGFSSRFQGPLDMRMDQDLEVTASHVVNEYDESQLQHVFSRYGELRNSRSLAKEIVRVRRDASISTIDDLKEAIRDCVKGNPNKYYAQLFQALRIEVNDELNALSELLRQSIEALKTGGRLVVISYHSLEDRLVKNYMKKGIPEGDRERDLYGNVDYPLRPINKKPIVPSAGEITKNSRARSAKLRIAEKN